MRHILATLLLTAALSSLVIGCDDPGSPGSALPHPPLNSAPFDRDLPAEAALTTVLQTGDTVYFFGGRRDDGRAVDSVWAYVLSSRTWIARSPMPTPRYYAAAVSSAGAIYVIGGRDNVSDGDRLHRVVERYDPVRDEWTTLPAASPRGFDGSYPTYVTAAGGKIYALSTARTASATWLYESTDGITWSEHRLDFDAGVEPTLMSDGRDLFAITAEGIYFGQGFYRIDPRTYQTRPDAPAYDWMRGYANRWIALDGYIYNLNGFDGEDDVLATYSSAGTSWTFNSVPYDITSNRHFTPIIVDRGLATLYFCAPPQLRIGVHYAALDNRFFVK